MIGEENGGRSMSKLGTIVLTNGVESVPEKQNANSEGESSKEYLPAAGAFAVPVKVSGKGSSNSESSGAEKSGDVSVTDV